MKNKLFITIFLVLCILPSALMLLPQGNNVGANEAAKQLPEFITRDNKINIDYLSQFSDWFDHSIGLRNHMISIHNKMVASVFGESAEDKVVLGDDGWLFYAETLDNYQGTNRLSQREIYSISKTLQLMDEYLDATEIDFAFTVAPNKNSLYGDKMPERYKKSPQPSDMQLIQQQLKNTNVNYVDLFERFSAEEKCLYRKTDSHWTHQGAGLAADSIISALEKSADQYYGGETTEVSETGDLHKMIYPAFADNSKDEVYTKDFDFKYTRPMRSVEDNYIYTSGANKTGSLFMYRDSFGNTLHKYMANEYGEAVFCRLVPYDLIQVCSSNADTLVVEIVERNIKWIIDNPPIFVAPVRAIDTANLTDITKDVSLQCNTDETYTNLCRVSSDYTAKDTADIYICADGVLYEATPCTNGFVAYLPTNFNADMLKIYVSNN